MNVRRRHFITVLVGCAVLSPASANADVIWPALVVAERLFAAPPILVGLAVEILVLRLWLMLSWRRAAIAGLAMNVASAALGLVLVPLAGFLWEVFPGIALYKVFNIGTFNPGTWVATFLLASLTNAFVEAGVLRWLFKVPFTKRALAVLALANSASVGIAYLSLWLRPAEY